MDRRLKPLHWGTCESGWLNRGPSKSSGADIRCLGCTVRGQLYGKHRGGKGIYTFKTPSYARGPRHRLWCCSFNLPLLKKAWLQSSRVSPSSPAPDLSCETGIGQATAYSLAKHGVKQLALTDINAGALQTTTDELSKQYGSSVEVLAVEVDVSRQESVEAGISQTVSRFGRIDFAVNCAGIVSAAGGSPDVSLEAWNKHLSVNLTGVWLCQRAEVRQMLQQEPRGERYGRGSIINVSSIHGFVSSPSYFATGAYATAKHGVIGLTRTEATLYASKGIRINAICPGYVDTPFLAKAKDRPGLLEKLVNENTAMKRLGTMEEIGDSIMFLASPLSSFMAGSAMLVDGGYTAQ